MFTDYQHIRLKPASFRNGSVAVRTLLGFLLLFFTVSGLSALPLLVPADDAALVFLDRLATRGLIPRWLNDSYPLTRSDVADALKQALEAEDQLSEKETAMLYFLAGEYYPELGERRHELLSEDRENWWPAASGDHLRQAFGQLFRFDAHRDPAYFILHEGSRSSFRLNWSESIRSENRDAAHRLLWRDHFNLGLSLGGRLGVYLDATRLIQTYHEDYAEPSDAYRGGFLMKLDEGLEYYSYDYSHAYVSYQSELGNLTYSNYPLHWGNSSYSLFLDDGAPAYPALQWNTSFGHGKYTFMHGWLLPSASERDSVFNNRTYIEKYIVGHRWEFSPWPWMNAAFSEFVVYGDRPVEPSYMLPMIFLWSAQHNLNDRGNMLMGIEGELFPVDGLKLYGSFFLDELVLSELFNDWWANKQGYQMGMHLSGQSFPWASDLRLEISYVRPWTYTHKYDYNTFTHNGSGLGFPYGPNSLFFFIQSRMYPSVRLMLDLSFTQLLKGENPLAPGSAGYYPIGNDPNQNYNERDPALDQATTWIMGRQTLTRRLSLKGRYLLSNILQLEGELSLEKDHSGDYHPYYHVRFEMNY